MVRCQHARNEIARLLGLSANHFVVLEPVSVLMHYTQWLAIIYGSFVTILYFQCVWRMLRLDEKSKDSIASPPPRKSHVDASPESFGPQIFNPHAKTQHEMKIATSFLQVSSFSKYVSKRFWGNPFAQPCLRIRSSRKTLQLDSCAVPEGSPSMQTADRH